MLNDLEEYEIKCLRRERQLLIEETLTELRKDASLKQRYEIYFESANDGTGKDFTTGKPLKSFDEWLGY